MLHPLSGLEAVLDDVVEVIGTLSEEEWHRPSTCSGWSVKDTVAHLAAALDGLAHPTPKPRLGPDDDLEAVNDYGVHRLSRLSTTELCELYTRSITGAVPSTAIPTTAQRFWTDSG